MSASSRDLWLQARQLGDNPKGEWTFPLLLWRAIASQPYGLDWSYEPLSTWDQLVELVRSVDALAERGVQPDDVYHVTIGLRLFDEAYYVPDGRLPLPGPNEPYRGRHAVQLAGMADRETVVFVNSWGGERWGDSGHGYISREYFETYVDLLLASRCTPFGPSLAMDAELKRRSWAAARPDTILIDDVAAAWYTPNRPRGKNVQVGDESLDLARRTLFSAVGAPFEVVDLRLQEQLVARMHVVHEGTGSLVNELWVPPLARRRRYGSYMLEVADELAGRANTRAVTLLVNEVDARQVDGACSFARANGYQCAVASSHRPNIVATATQSIRNG